MPKIVIKEYDKTKAIANEYANFAVVVPGPVGKSSDLTVFDDNGIYECSSQADFVKKIGLLANVSATKEAKEAKAADPTPVTTTASGNYFKITVPVNTELTIYEKTNKKKNPGYLVDEEGYVYEYAFKTEGEGLFTEEEVAKYFIFEKGNEGSDAVAAPMFMGNQIAYELLGLGYTVFYKKYNNLSDNDLNTDMANDLEELAKPAFWEALKDKTNYDFRYIMTGYLSGGEATENIINVAKERGDCIALLDIDSSAYKGEDARDTKINNIISKANGYTTDKNCAIFLPTVVYDLTRSKNYEDIFKNMRFPASFHYLTCVANASERYAEWYAASGFTRGVSPFGIKTTDFTVGEAIIDKLQPRNQASQDSSLKTPLKHAVNVIAKFRNQYLLWGNRTANTLRAGDDDDLIASDFLNIRQLCCTLKKQIYVACRQLTFDPNSEMLWINFKNKIRPILEKMKADQGIQDYEFVKIANAPKATLKAQIRIVPIEAVEDFEIDVMLEDSLDGVTIGESEAE